MSQIDAIRSGCNPKNQLRSSRTESWPFNNRDKHKQEEYCDDRVKRGILQTLRQGRRGNNTSQCQTSQQASAPLKLFPKDQVPASNKRGPHTKEEPLITQVRRRKMVSE